jgi:hypothetical protein
LFYNLNSKKILNPFKMKKFIVIYHAPTDALMETANASPEEQAKGMVVWYNWAKK